LMHHGHLYGILGPELAKRSSEMLARLGLADRAGQRVEKLSGGLKRRVELAKGLLHRPEILILDEPSTGLDPGARVDLWQYLKTLRDENDVTILVTTHLMEEADACDRLAILNQGEIVSIGKPDALKREISGDVIVVESRGAEALARAIKNKFQNDCVILDGKVQIEHENGAAFIAKLAGAFPEEILALTVRKPTLEDVFIHRTGHRFWNAGEMAHV
jgi:ABC-2 type transport system ATP-binding protein